jgi:hypothetical protein
MEFKEQDFKIELSQEVLICGSEIYKGYNIKPLIILKCKENCHQGFFTNNIKELIEKVLEQLKIKNINDALFALYYPNMMHINIPEDSLCVVNFSNDNNDPSFSRSITRDELSKYSGYKLKNI